jgi:hypothetical protein
MIKHLEASIRKFEDRRILIISWLLAALIGVFGNLFASSVFGGIGNPSWGFAIIFLVASCLAAGALIYFFPPMFEHSFQVWFGEDATQAEKQLTELLNKHFAGKKTFELHNVFDLGDFFRIYNLILVKDCLMEHPARLTKVVEVMTPEHSYETWVTVRLRGKFSWLRRSIRKELWDELGLFCDVFATTTVPLRWVDDQASEEQIRVFDSALGSIRFDNIKASLRQQILTHSGQ